MNVNQIVASDIIANFTTSEGGVILHKTAPNEVAMHSYTKTGELHTGSYLRHEDDLKRLFIARIQKEY